MSTYINLVSGEYIPSESIVKDTSNGLMYYESGCWKFLQKGEYRVLSDDETKNDYNSKVSTISISVNDLIDPSTVTEQSVRYYTTYFGLNSLDIGYKHFAETSGILTEPISVLTGKPLKLKADLFQPAYTSIEFSILDGTKETPIVPVSQKTIQDEKIFFGLDTRMTGNNLVYQKNFQIVQDIADQSDIFDKGVIYTVSYTPDESWYSYTPINDTIKIKVIFRRYQDDSETPQVSNLFVTQEVS